MKANPLKILSLWVNMMKKLDVSKLPHVIILHIDSDVTQIGEGEVTNLEGLL